MRKLLTRPYPRRSQRINTTTSKASNEKDLEARLAAALAKAQTGGQIGATARRYSSNRSSTENIRLNTSERTDSDGFRRDSSELTKESGDSIAIQRGGIERPEVQTTDESLTWWKEFLNDTPLVRCWDDPEENELWDKLYNEVFFTLDDMENRDGDFWDKVRTELMPSEEETFIEWDGYWPGEDLDDEGHGADGLKNFMQRGKNLLELKRLRKSIYGTRLRYIHSL